MKTVKIKKGVFEKISRYDKGYYIKFKNNTGLYVNKEKFYFYEIEKPLKEISKTEIFYVEKILKAYGHII